MLSTCTIQVRQAPVASCPGPFKAGVCGSPGREWPPDDSALGHMDWLVVDGEGYGHFDSSALAGPDQELRLVDRDFLACDYSLPVVGQLEAI